MSSRQKVLIVTQKFTCSVFELEHEAMQLADAIARVPGLEWKLWLVNRHSRTAGGIYLFDCETSLRLFVDGPIAARLLNRPEAHAVSLKAFNLLELPDLAAQQPDNPPTRHRNKTSSRKR